LRESSQLFLPFGLSGRLADTLLKGTAHFVSLGPKYVASAINLTVLFSVAAITKNERFHGFLAIYFIIHTIMISFAFFRTLM